MKKKRTAALLLLALLLCNFSMQAFASDNALEDAIIEPTSSNDSEAPEGWNGATEADYDKMEFGTIQRQFLIGHCLIAQNILIMRALLYFQIIFILLKINGMHIRLV